MIPFVLSVLLACSESSSENTVTFLPDDAQVACLAILPQCFTRRGWADLCLQDPTIRSGYPQACREALGDAES